MNWKRLAGGLACACSLAMGCGGSDTSPTRSTPPTLSSVAVSGGASVAVGATTALAATATYSDASTQVVTASSTWESSAGVASVAGGVVTGVAAGSTSISATYQGVRSPAFAVQVTAVAPSVLAAITVFPRNPADGNENTCPVIPQSPSGSNRLDCRFDSAGSVPAGSITAYRWEIPSGTANIFTTATVDGQSVACGTLSGISQGSTRDVKLTITTATGATSVVTKSVTFTKANPC